MNQLQKEMYIVENLETYALSKDVLSNSDKMLKNAIGVGLFALAPEKNSTLSGVKLTTQPSFLKDEISHNIINGYISVFDDEDLVLKCPHRYESSSIPHWIIYNCLSRQKLSIISGGEDLISPDAFSPHSLVSNFLKRTIKKTADLGAQTVVIAFDPCYLARLVHNTNDPTHFYSQIMTTFFVTLSEITTAQNFVIIPKDKKNYYGFLDLTHKLKKNGLLSQIHFKL